jgi:membrane protein
MKTYLSKETPSRLLLWADSKPEHLSNIMRALHAVTRIFYITTTEYKRNDLFLRASALTYIILLSLVPLLAISTALVKGLGDDDKLRQAAYSYIENLENQESQLERIVLGRSVDEMVSPPSSTLSTHLKSAIDKLFNYVDRTNFTTLGTFGILGIILSVLLVLANIEGAMNTIWHIDNGRSVLRKIADYLALIVLMPLSLNVGLAAGAVVTSEALLSQFTILLPAVWVQTLLLNLIPIFFLSLTLFVIYLFFPNTRVKTMPAFIGAVIAGFFWFEIQNIYLTLQIGVTNYNAIYGSFATLPLFLVWMYCGWVFILLGAQIAFACQNISSYQLHPQPQTPALQLSAAFDIMDQVYNSFNAGNRLTIDELQDTYTSYQPDVLAQVTQLLIANGILHTSKENGNIMPSLAEERTGHEKIILAILGTKDGATPGAETSDTVITAAANAQFKQIGKE